MAALNSSPAPPVREPLPFTLEEVKNAIPKHLFQVSQLTSWYYLFRDFCQVALAVACCYSALHLVGPDATLLRALIWCTYIFCQGTTCFGLWVIGHECGHQAYFGTWRNLNEVMGFLLHTVHFVPYHSWRVTHATHHRYTNNIQKDTVFVPKTEPAWNWGLGKKNPIFHYMMIGGYFASGFVVYLLQYWEGTPEHLGWSHFNPKSPFFTPRDFWPIVVCNMGNIGMLGLTAWASFQWGFANVFLWYLAPVMMNNAWLVCITFLQHTDRRIPHYDEKTDNFDFLKGALCTVDRDYGIFNNWMHHITDRHVVHHIFSRMPFYNARDATPYVAKVCGKHYITDARPLWTQLWDSWIFHAGSFMHSKEYARKGSRPN